MSTPATETIAPRAAAFAVKMADGDVGALQILGYDAGRYRLALTFAGPGATSF